MAFLNPNLNRNQIKKVIVHPKQLVSELQEGNITALGQAITLVESKLESDQKRAQTLIKLALPTTGSALRIGISGVPGVGKSTFIEAFGNYLITHHQKRVAVLAVDPSSQRTGGSILGDKTRMERLAQNELAFIRPSPAAGTLGGVAEKTRQSMLLCEAAGFDVVIVETVGVGQSETVVKSMVDCFLLLLLPGAGDELQGIKRGIMEMADIIAINKADGDFERKAQLAAAEVRRALHLFPAENNGWTVPVVPCSALQNVKIDLVWEKIIAFETHLKSSGLLQHNRKTQMRDWFQELLQTQLIDWFLKNKLVAAHVADMQAAVVKGEIDPSEAVIKMLALLDTR